MWSSRLCIFVLICFCKLAWTFDCRMDPGSSHPNCGLPYELSNFAGQYKCDKRVTIGRPRNLEELANLVRHFDHVKGVGVGHSWWREQFCPRGEDKNSIGITLTEMDTTKAVFSASGDKSRAMRVNEEDMTVSVAAGVPQRALLDFLAKYRSRKAPEGVTIPSHSWFIDQTIGGAVATGSHGSSLSYGTLSDHLVALDLMLANGTLVTLSRTKDPHLFRAAQVSVGRLGIITQLRFRLIPNLPLQRTKKDVKVVDWVGMMTKLQEDYLTAKKTGDSAEVWRAIAPWDNVQLFWHYSDYDLWLVNYTKIRDPKEYERLKSAKIEERQSRSEGDRGLPGAFSQKYENPMGGLAFINEFDAKYWSQWFKAMLLLNVNEDVYPAAEASLAMTEIQNVFLHTLGTYDQYEVTIPFSSAGDCIKEVVNEMYSRKLWQGFRSPGLVRFVGVKGSGGGAYLSPDIGEPHVYINLEDYLYPATKKDNKEFLEVMAIFRSRPSCNSRLHWGKAGWPRYAQCFDGSREYPGTWCDFGCAVNQLDPTGKFSSSSDVWHWTAMEAGQTVPLEQCCNPTGFNKDKCQCSQRTSCQ